MLVLKAWRRSGRRRSTSTSIYIYQLPRLPATAVQSSTSQAICEPMLNFERRLRPSANALIKRAFQRIGLNLSRFPQSDPIYQLTKLMVAHQVDLVLDVGANDGGYARAIRRHGYSGRIVSFEPLSEPFHRLREFADRDNRWDTHQVAVGDHEGQAVINVAGNNGASSSLLPMLDRHIQAAPGASYVGTEAIAVTSLDRLVATTVEFTGESAFLKIDVQGYEREVLAGASQLLADRRLTGLQMELSFEPLYEDGMDWRDALAVADKLGFSLMQLIPGFCDLATGQMLQADAVLFRARASRV
jgi:FkbM family methyltransferase